ncbi:LysR family transcriptional regulator [Rhizobium sp. P38BS-XIX]|uniref:LysR family transcriptional regulator n=1 Tax=Rhizobium sp. P38BS-XIX TaxID=2726740 RepID=UPI0014565C49|nr:LysR family transcriptional regulator [Rhizobium sp. P38BS-XIX]NLR99928.1 LysR family transcriptional regulator [Rhizobium sp. P38BS-XIX]
MQKFLDIEAVRALILVADLKSFTRAAEALGTTQSAVSLKVKRLEENVGVRLLERTPRMVRLSIEGAAFLGAARTLVAAHQQALGSLSTQRRKLSVGISHHVVGPRLPLVLKYLKDADPQFVLDVRVAMSRQIIDDLDAGRLDAGIILHSEDRRRDGQILFEETFGWRAAPDYQPASGLPLQLATQGDPCSVRSMAIMALDNAGIPWEEAFVGGGTAAIGAAVSAGLAIAALGSRVAPVDTIDCRQSFGLPKLPTREVILYANTSDRRARNALYGLAAAIRTRT